MIRIRTRIRQADMKDNDKSFIKARPVSLALQNTATHPGSALITRSYAASASRPGGTSRNFARPSFNESLLVFSPLIAPCYLHLPLMVFRCAATLHVIMYIFFLFQIRTHKSKDKLSSPHTNSQDNIGFDLAKCAAQLLYGHLLVVFKL